MYAPRKPLTRGRINRVRAARINAAEKHAAAAFRKESIARFGLVNAVRMAFGDGLTHEAPPRPN